MTARNQTLKETGQRDDQILAVDDLSVEYASSDGPVKAVRDVSLDLCRGETLGIAGESGSGKSTLALAILQYLGENGSVVSGDIRFRGESLIEMSPKELRSIRGKEIAHVAQDPEKSLNPSMVVGEQIAETVRIHRDLDGSAARNRVHEILRDVQISDPEFVFDQYPHELSGGMQQRILIAMALSCNPDVLVLDEPTTGLDVTTQANILNLIENLKNDFETSILLISHNLGVLSEVADRIAILYAGELMENGPIDAIFRSPANPYTQGLLSTVPEIDTENELVSIPGRIPDLTDIPGGCIFADRCEFAEPECRENAIELEGIDSDHRTRCRRWEAVTRDPIVPETKSINRRGRGEKILELSDIHKYYDVPGPLDSLFDPDPPVKAVNGVDLSLYEGESLALVGESGCGKSTLGRTILDLVDATSGEILYRGAPLDEMTADQYKRFRSECQIIFQNPDSSLNPRKTVFSLIERPLRLFTELTESGRRERVAELLSRVGLGSAYASQYPHELSGGEKQRIAIARAFAAEPSFVVLDEPVSSLDVSVQANILNLLRTLSEEYNTSYLFISHDLSVVRHLCDRIAVMYLGEIVETGRVSDVFESPKHPYTEALMNSVPSISSRDKSGLLPTLEGEVPSPRDPPSGCEFHTRCPNAREACVADDPALSFDTDERGVACFREREDHEYWSSGSLDHADRND
jgi:peptide/nickel transport system ATP-binding protein